MAYVGQLQTTLFLALLMMTTLLVSGCYGHESYFYITPDPDASCGEDHEPCLTLDQFASESINESLKLFLIPGQHNLTRSIEIVGADHFSILANTSVTIQCTSPASFLFENISFLKITNEAIVSCGGGGSSGAVQVKSVQQFDFSNVTLQESASVSLNVQNSNGLVTGARFIGNTGAGMNITNSTVTFEGANTFSDNLGGGIASYNSTLEFIGVNQFTNNTATSGGGISAISSTIDCSGNMTFEYNSAEQYGGGVYASGTRMTSESHIRFIGNTASEYYSIEYYGAGGGLYAEEDSTVDFNAECDFINNSAVVGGGVLSAFNTVVNINAGSNFIDNSALAGGGVFAYRAAVNISRENNFINNSAQHNGGGVYAWSDSRVYLSGTSNFMYNSAQWHGGGVCAWKDTTVYLSGTSNFMYNSAQLNGGGVCAWRDTTVNLSGTSNFMYNSAQLNGGGLFAWSDTTVYLSGTSNFMNNSAQQDGGGVFARSDTTVYLSGTSNFMYNSAQYGGGVFAWSDTTVYLSGTSNFMYNSAQLNGGGVCAVSNTTAYLNGTSNFMYNSAQQDGGGVSAWNNTAVYLSGTSSFMYNSAQQNGGGVYAWDGAIVNINGTSNFMYNSAQRYGGAFFLQQSEVHISDNSSFTMNSASLRGGGMCLQTNSIAYIKDSVFSDNWSMYGGGISILQSGIMLQGNIVFSNNSASYGGAIQALDAKINITGNDSFTQNLATVNGGALALAGGSVVYLIFETASLTFSENIANYFGGAIFVEDNSVHCSYDWNVNGFIGINGPTQYECDYLPDLPRCLNSKLASFKDNINISFSSNSAMAGSVIFGGEIDETVLNIRFHYFHADIYPTIGDLFHYLINVNIDDTNNGSIVSSTPNRVCGCINGQPDCSDPQSAYDVSVYPGQTVKVSLVAVGQRNGTVPSTITAQYVSDDGATFRDFQSTQTSNPTCTELYYTIFSQKETEVIELYAEGTCGAEGIPLSVNVILLDCPIGFTLNSSTNQCFCDERLQRYTKSCNIDNGEITRISLDDFWVGVDNTNETEGLILHPHCPFDYCTTYTVHFTLVDSNDIPVANGTESNSNRTNATLNDIVESTGNNTSSDAIGNNIDAQCNYDRSGLLCGKCKKDFSFVFGSSKCIKCSNIYLSLLIAFTLAGIVLVVFLLVLKLTVAVGTINGLIFYANIVSVNRAHLFPSGETNILTVFIAWVNLDLGIETCFFDGMDAYSKAWLQYAFPVYVWTLVGAIILASRHSNRIARSLGSNPVAVLATLFLLSYAKLLRSIINPLYVTFLEYPSGTKEVWLVDGNIPYLEGKHIPLFLTSLLALLLLFIPFTLLLLLGQWIQAQSERKCFKWISDYRVTTFLDVYHGPFKSKHRYWCGLLLVTRFVLFLISAFNVDGDPRINILSVAVCLIGLSIMFSWFRVYKAWYLNALEASFIINALILHVAVGTFYVEVTSGGNQRALTYTSVSVAFATFCGIVVYHSCLQIKDTILFKKLYKKLTHCLKSSADDTGAGDIEMKDIEEDPPRKYTKPPTTSVVEITH